MKTLLSHKKAQRDFEIQKIYNAGIELRGFEVKALKAGMGSLEGSHITVRGEEAYLLNAHIPPYQAANTPEGYDTRRKRRLLLHKKEIRDLAQAEHQAGLTIVPLSVYNNDGKVKVQVALVHGKKKHDKRESIKRKDMQRDTERTLKKRFR